MTDWEKTLLGKIGNDIRNSYKPNNEVSLPYIGYEHIDQQTLLLLAIGKSNETQSNKKKFKSGDIVFGTLRPYFRKVIIPNFDGVCSTDLAVIRANKGYDQKFLFYILASQPLIDYADVSSNGTKMPRAKWGVLSKTIWLVPDLPKQIHIGSILSAYDDLIGVNTQRIKLLEETSRELYKEWFVRMRFPGYKEAKFVKGLPEDWSLKELQELGIIYTGKTPSTKRREYYGGNIPFIKTPNLHKNQFIFETEEYLTEKGNNTQKRSTLPKGSICVSCIGTVGIVGITTAEKSQTNQQINSLIPINKSTLEYLFHAISDLKETIELYGYTGATMSNLSKGKFEKLKILYAKQALVEKYSHIVNPMFEQIQIMQQQNTQLRQIRDRLLPRLISGKLQIKVGVHE